MKIPCELVQDMIPLYIDEGCSETSKELLEEHLKECEDCGTVYQNMKEDLPMEQKGNREEIEKENQKYLAEIKPMKKVKKRHIVITAVACVVMILLGIKATTTAVDAGMYPYMVAATPTPVLENSIPYMDTIPDISEETQTMNGEEFTVRIYREEKAEEYVMPEGLTLADSAIGSNPEGIYGVITEVHETVYSVNGTIIIEDSDGKEYITKEEKLPEPEGEYDEKVHSYVVEYSREGRTEIVLKCAYTVRRWPQDQVRLMYGEYEVYTTKKYSNVKLEAPQIDNTNQTGLAIVNLEISNVFLGYKKYQETFSFVVTPTVYVFH